ncbi:MULTISPECIES: deoxyribonuclease IV [Thermomonospora]|uniref:Xylose isomerase domain protein TIM barrel n=1 Tax=Thermomonospora curvata (strain ATCC 19995 / DSM 43183 / JCM 3096 / KCTC 9072 / NBRC 15933 / NCIMB 10081 / Henssen B9) TaxID=471852 RepID=D1A8F3_THECD|nr:MULTISPECIES: deoxyribonuclease IV [Thermomonospora]ACZ00468.1 Xylose isomerase domain protein TIM barrel [Thermomonospora curvata DSM 43183]PKK11848.1 MAG: deoxyribonuclease IV [Thermomonospora sp. CIF 1]
MRIGAHVDQHDPLAGARAVGAEVVQFFLGDPQGWKKPVVPEAVAELDGSGVDVYIHAPYVVNVATSNNRIRVPSRRILSEQLQAAAQIGAKALIVHGGHVLSGDDPEVGFENWRKVFERIDCPIPIYIENTAGGGNAMARRLDRIARLWEVLGQVPGIDGKLGFCLDTCHAHAAGEELIDVVDRIKAITGRIDLVHCNNSRDAFGSGADRHANLESGTIDTELIVSVVRSAGAPVVVETPPAGQAADIALLRAALT